MRSIISLCPKQACAARKVRSRKHAAFGEGQREGGIVADGADVAEMIGEALKLGHQRAEPHGARRNIDLKRGFDRLREGERVSHGAVARGAAGELRALVERGAGHQRLGALVHITEPLFEPHHRLAVGGEAEMPWLDDAGMDRADRDLVQILSLNGQEGVGVGFDCTLSPLAERMGHAPETEIEPMSRICGACGFVAIKVGDGALEPDRRRVMHADRGKLCRRGREG